MIPPTELEIIAWRRGHALCGRPLASVAGYAATLGNDHPMVHRAREAFAWLAKNPAAKKTAPRPAPIKKPAPRPAPKARPLPAAAKATAKKITPKVEPMSTQKAIAQLGKIAADPRNPDRGRAARALERMAHPDRVEGVTYASPHAEELDKRMGLSTAGTGVRVEGSRLILSATGKAAGAKRPATVDEVRRLIGGLL